MLVNDKGLIRALKAAYKGLGYKVARDSVNLYILSESWAVKLQFAATPRKVLALLVEQMGIIPQANRAYEIRKRNVQDYMPDMVQKELPKSLYSKSGDDICQSLLTLNGATLWQVTDTGVIVPAAPELEDIVLYNKATSVRYEDHFIVAFGEYSTVAIRESFLDSAEGIRRNLQAIDLIT